MHEISPNHLAQRRDFKSGPYAPAAGTDPSTGEKRRATDNSFDSSRAKYQMWRREGSKCPRPRPRLTSGAKARSKSCAGNGRMSTCSRKWRGHCGHCGHCGEWLTVRATLSRWGRDVPPCRRPCAPGASRRWVWTSTWTILSILLFFALPLTHLANSNSRRTWATGFLSYAVNLIRPTAVEKVDAVTGRCHVTAVGSSEEVGGWG